MLIDLLNSVLGSIAVHAAPHNINSLACISVNAPDAVKKAFHGLHSILDIPENLQHPIRLHHATFREFILSPNRCTDWRFIVDGTKQHNRIALRACTHVALSAPSALAASSGQGVVNNTTLFVNSTTLFSNRTTPEVAARTRKQIVQPYYFYSGSSKPTRKGS